MLVTVAGMVVSSDKDASRKTGPVPWLCSDASLPLSDPSKG